MNVVKTTDNVNKLLQDIDALTKLEVLVGVPADNSMRDDTKMTNAAIAYVHEFGSPAHNIPERPFLRPGVKNAKADIAKVMEQGAKDALAGKRDAASKTLNTVGMIGRNSVVKAITDPVPPFAPLKPATIRARLRRTQAGRRRIKQLKQKGVPLTVWAQQQTTPGGGMNIMPLLDTLRLRNSITYVIRQAAVVRTGTKFGFQPDYGKIVLR